MKLGETTTLVSVGFFEKNAILAVAISLHLTNSLKHLVSKCFSCKNITMESNPRKIFQGNTFPERSSEEIISLQDSCKALERNALLTKILRDSFKKSQENAFSCKILKDSANSLQR